MHRVLVTRPQPGAARTADELARRGFAPLVLPLSEIVPLKPAGAPAIEKAHAVAVASANAVRHAPPDLLARIASLPAYAVGERTGETATAAGLRVVHRDSGDAEGLVRTLATSLEPGTRVLLLCGRVRRDTLESGLAQAGLLPCIVETYDTLLAPPAEREVAALLAGRPVEAVMLYSAMAAGVFAQVAAMPAAERLLEQAAILAISRRVADALPQSMRGRVRVASAPNEEAMLSLLGA